MWDIARRATVREHEMNRRGDRLTHSFTSSSVRSRSSFPLTTPALFTMIVGSPTYVISSILFPTSR